MKTAKLFQNGQSQAVRLPKEFRFKGDEVLIKKVGAAVMLLPKENHWQPFLDSLKKFKGKIERNQPKDHQKRDWPWP
jgi:antitoxin VapB